MAMHAVKAGEGEVFISAGVETVSRHVNGSSDSPPDTMNPLFGDARAHTATAAKGGAEGWHDPREDGMLPDAYIAMGLTERRQGTRTRDHPARPDRCHRGERAVAGNDGPRPCRGD
jgi:acetyl-CoA C-acetyltransferase